MLSGPKYLISRTIDISFDLEVLWKDFWDIKGFANSESLETSAMGLYPVCTHCVKEERELS